jgi:hypothetical protein
MGDHKFTATKVPRQCPLFLLVKAGFVKVRCLEVEKVRLKLEQGEKLSRVLLHLYTILNFDINLGRAVLIFKNSVRSARKTRHFTITKINFIMLFKEIIAVYTEIRTRPMNAKCTDTDC